MNPQEIKEGNERIKDLMGGTIKIQQEDVKDIPLAFLTVDDLKFHVSWKWLMPVVIKIEEELGHVVTIEGHSCKIQADDDTSFEQEADSKLEAIWQSIVSFLEWKEDQ